VFDDPACSSRSTNVLLKFGASGDRLTTNNNLCCSTVYICIGIWAGGCEHTRVATTCGSGSDRAHHGRVREGEKHVQLTGGEGGNDALKGKGSGHHPPPAGGYNNRPVSGHVRVQFVR
jgi:hypothetical protein